MSARARLAGGLLAAALGSACGAAPPPAPATPAAAPSGSEGGPVLQSETPASPGELKSPEPAEPAYAEPETLADAEQAFQLGASELQGSALSAAPDCELMRKALDSMQRSRGRICDLNGPDDPGKRCRAASEQLDEARAEYRRACGS